MYHVTVLTTSGHILFERSNLTPLQASEWFMTYRHNYIVRVTPEA